jgi:hypothetical protein
MGYHGDRDIHDGSHTQADDNLLTGVEGGEGAFGADLVALPHLDETRVLVQFVVFCREVFDGFKVLERLHGAAFVGDF